MAESVGTKLAYGQRRPSSPKTSPRSEGRATVSSRLHQTFQSLKARNWLDTSAMGRAHGSAKHSHAHDTFRRKGAI